MAQRLNIAGLPASMMKYIEPLNFWAEYIYFYREGALFQSGAFLFEQGDIYAPTATELLPKGYHLSHMSTREGGSVWAAFFDDNGGHCGFNENPHDAAAKAWLWEKGNE